MTSKGCLKPILKLKYDYNNNETNTKSLNHSNNELYQDEFTQLSLKNFEIKIAYSIEMLKSKCFYYSYTLHLPFLEMNFII